MCVCKCMCSSVLAFFLSLPPSLSFPSRGFFVATTFCMRSILFAGSNRESERRKKSHRLSSPPTQQEGEEEFSFLSFFYTERKVSFARRARSLSFARCLFSSPRECMTRACSTCLHKKEISFISTNHFLARY